MSFAQTDWQDLKMGSSAKDWQSKAKDISNPNSLDEKIYQLNEDFSFYGLKSPKIELYFYNNRLYAWEMFFDANQWQTLKEILTSKIDAKGKVYEDKKEGFWYWGESKKQQFSVFTHNNEMKLNFTDYIQKEFHWKDLFSGSLFYVMLTIVGGAILYLVVAWLWVSYCPKCNAFTMEHIKRDSEVRFRRDPNEGWVEAVFSNNPGQMYLQSKDYYKCKKCGHTNIYKSKSKNR